MMKQLLRKELKLSIQKFFYFLPIILGLLMFIPNWIFMFIFYYFIWISVPQIYGHYQATRDYEFTVMLPVKREDIVKAKAFALYIIESLHIITAVIFGLIHNHIYGSFNFFFDINLAFFGLAILLYGLFNVIFLPGYFKTAHFFGKPLIYASIATIIFGFIFEFGIVAFPWMRDVFESSIQTQMIPFVITTSLGILMSILAVKRSIHVFKVIDL